MRGTLLISLDCEGKWGMADDPSMLGHQSITDNAIRWAYSQLLSLLEVNRLRATFAGVGLFMIGQERAIPYINELSQSRSHREWLAIPSTAVAIGDLDGWFYEDLPSLVSSSGDHELASHGFSHLPFGTDGISEDTARFELNTMQKLSDSGEWKIRSMVFPRNQVSFTNLLSEYGITKYRGGSVGDGTSHRLRMLGNEFKIWSKAESIFSGSEVPAGRFLNWRSGGRRVVPSNVTVRRWNQIMGHAARTGGCAHLWFHPHNLITGRNQLDLVSRVLRLAGEYVRKGHLYSTTFSEVEPPNPVIEFRRPFEVDREEHDDPVVERQT